MLWNEIVANGHLLQLRLTIPWQVVATARDPSRSTPVCIAAQQAMSRYAKFSLAVSTFQPYPIA
ncbi:hypothetical protein C8Q79DRAFT_949905 [Trametes meyenii]|nr:hypothetical protein C8Q79DRAFT_949905 [Trametes meyenii]